MTISPSRRVITAQLACATAAGVLAWLGYRLHLAALPLLLTVFALAQLYRGLDALVGRVELRPDGIRVRRLVGVKTFTWPDVWAVYVVTTPYGRHARIRWGTRNSVRLPTVVSPYLFPDREFDEKVATVRASAVAAGVSPANPANGWGPRWVYPLVAAALLVGMAVSDRAGGWVAGPEAAALPDACKAVQAAVAGVDPSARGEAAPGASIALDSRLCRFGIGPDQMAVTLFVRYERVGLHSATSVAGELFGTQVPAGISMETPLGTATPVDGAPRLGDESIVVAFDRLRESFDALSGSTLRGTMAIARRANVVVVVFLGQRPDAPFDERPHGTPAEIDHTVEIVRAALAAITLS